VPTLQRWKPGQTIRVSFSGGDSTLHQKIAEVASEWVTKGGINLSFSFTEMNGKYRTWKPSDHSYSAEIRIAFKSGDMGGYWSHVGTDSINQELVGGQPSQASMNLDSFDRTLPVNWVAVVLHEFGHALGFEHEHQNPTGGCDFRFEDDSGYVMTKDSDGWYTVDANGKRPGLYTYLGGYANYWSRATVDRNLRSLPTSKAFMIGPFDSLSIMKYFFDAFMFEMGEKSPCYTSTENLTLSAQDITGAQTAYPRDPRQVILLRDEKKAVLQNLKVSPDSSIELRNYSVRQLQTF
jgi:hypothetical protein